MIMIGCSRLIKNKLDFVLFVVDVYLDRVSEL